MACLKDLRFLRFIPLMTLLFGVPVLAQFEVAPDHFDSNGKNAVTHKSAVKNTTSVARPARLPVADHATPMSAAKVHPRRNAGRNAHRVAGSLKPK